MYDGYIYIGTNSSTQKARNIARDSRVAFCVDEGIRSPIYGLSGIGKADLISEVSKVHRLATRILHRYMETIDESGQQILDDTDCIIRITISKITAWSA